MCHSRFGCLPQDHYRQMLAPGGKFAKSGASSIPVGMPGDTDGAAASGDADGVPEDMPELTGLAAAIPGLDPSMAIEDQPLSDAQMAALLDQADKQEVRGCRSHRRRCVRIRTEGVGGATVMSVVLHSVDPTPACRLLP